MNVVFLNPVGVLGGAERCLLDILAVIRARRPTWKLHLIAGTPGALLEEAAKIGVETRVVPMPGALARFGDSGLAISETGWLSRGAGLAWKAVLTAAVMPGYLHRLRSAIAATDPQLVHTNGLKSHLVAGYVAPRGVPVVWHLQDFLTTRPLVGRGLRRFTKKPARLIAISHAVRADAERALPGVATQTVPSGIDTDRFTPGAADGAALDRLAGLPEAPPGVVRVGLVATYARWKGQPTFLEAAARLAARTDLPPLRFLIVGGPVYQTAGSQFRTEELQGFIREQGLQTRAGLVPFQREMPSVYRSLDVVIHASTKPEPFGLTIAEAMACERAVIVSNAGGASELFTNGRNAVGVPPGDAAALAEAIASLAADPALRGSLGTAARGTVVARFSRQRMGEGVLAVYDSLQTT